LSDTELRVDGARLRADLQALGGIGRDPAGGITRTTFSAADRQAREWYRQRCADAGLTVAVDPVGNMVARAPGAGAGPAVWSGSHIDTVPNGGAFDGALGVVAALECLRRVTELGLDLARPLAAAVFADEEGNYSHLFGSSALARGFGEAELTAMTGRDGDRLLDTMAAQGWALDGLAETRLGADVVDMFVELHIEQGPKMEAAGAQIGVVSSIVGLAGGLVEFTGRADHAGTTPMTERRDPLRAAADLIAALPSIAASVSSTAVATCGRVDTEPGGANVVPSLVRLALDYRDQRAADVDRLASEIAAVAGMAARRHGVEVAWLPDSLIAPVGLDAGIQRRIEANARGRGLSVLELPSGAGHDAQNMAQVAPTAMIFVPSHEGRSHSPAEHTDWSDVENGANVLLATLVDLAS
jgi:N-carbamoyl-L-amino-acid hydrolase